MGLPSGRLSISHAADKKSAGHPPPPFTVLEDGEEGSVGARATAQLQTRSSLRSIPSLPFSSRHVVADEEESVESRESRSVSTDEKEQGRGGGYSVSNENNGPRALPSPPSQGRRVLAPAAGYAEGGSGAVVFGSSRGFGGVRDVSSVRHPQNPINNFIVAVDPEFEGLGAHAQSWARFPTK